MTAADAPRRHTCRFTAPIEIVNYIGSQFVNQIHTHFYEITAVKHHMTISSSKEENVIVERANKEVNRHVQRLTNES